MNNFQEFELNSDVYKAVTACGYTIPTPVQSKAIPEVMAGKDVVVSAQTGTGKTAAFVLPALHNLSLRELNKKTRVLILTPTRELASQITKAASLYGKFLRFNIVSLVGGMPYHGQIKDLARGADIIVATPGRLLDHMEQKRVDLSNVEMLVLDEADRMLDMGFIDDVQYIAKLTPSQRQTLLFSATLDNKLMNAVKHLLKNPVRIDLSHEKLAAPKIRQEMYKANSPMHKTRMLKHFLNDENIFKAIIFSATKINADRLTTQLRDEGFAASALHGDLRQNVRNRTLEQLRRGKIQFLVATDVAARGIDISDITHVINYDLPRFCEDYVHRIGRTGRAGKEGVAISFVLPSETRNLNSIERYIGQRLQLIQNIEINENAEPRNRNYVPEELSVRKDRKSGGGFSDRRSSNRQDRFEKSDREDRTARFGKSDRDDRPARFGKSDRDDRPARFEKSDRDDKPARFGKSDRDDRPARFEKSDRDDRPARFGKSDRDDRPARFEKSDRDDRPARSSKSDHDDRPARFGKSDRDDRPARFGKSDRDDRPARFGKSDRDDRPARFGKSDRDDRPARFGKSDRDDRPARFGKSDRDDRPARFSKSDRDDRPARFGKSDRDDRPARSGKSDNGEKAPYFGKAANGDKLPVRYGKSERPARSEFKKEYRPGKKFSSTSKERSGDKPKSGKSFSDNNRAFKKKSMEKRRSFSNDNDSRSR